MRVSFRLVGRWGVVAESFAVGAEEVAVCEPSDDAFAVCVEDREAVVVGGAESPDGFLKRLIDAKRGGLVYECARVFRAWGVGECLFDVACRDDAEERPVVADHWERVGALGGEAVEDVLKGLVGVQWLRQRAGRLGDRDLRHQAGPGGCVDVDAATAEFERVDRLARHGVGYRCRDDDGDHQWQDHSVVAGEFEDDQDCGDRRSGSGGEHGAHPDKLISEIYGEHWNQSNDVVSVLAKAVSVASYWISQNYKGKGSWVGNPKAVEKDLIALAFEFYNEENKQKNGPDELPVDE